MTQPVAVVGVAQTRHAAANREASTQELVYDAAHRAVEGAGLSRDEIDTVVLGASDMVDGIAIANVYAVGPAGAWLKDESRVEDDAAFAAFYAWARILSGRHETALVAGWGKGSEVDPEAPRRLVSDPFYLRPLGVGAVEAAALQARAYLDRVGAAEADVAPWTALERRRARGNPNAHGGAEMGAAEVLGAEAVALPIRRWDLPPVSDGAAAVVLASEGFVRDRRLRPIAWIRGAGTSTDGYALGARPLDEAPSARRAAAEACRRAGGVDPARCIGIAEVSEPGAYQGPLLAEALGLCPEGQGVRFLTGKEPPVNPSGGNLGADPAPATGLVRLVETALQVGGRAGAHQVRGASWGLAHASSGLALQSNTVFLLTGSAAEAP